MTNIQSDNFNSDTFYSFVKEYLIEFSKKFYLIILTFAVCGVFFFFKWKKNVDFYKSELSFYVESAGNTNAIVDFLPSLFNSNSIKSKTVEELLYSQNIIFSTLFTPIEIDGQKDLIANFLIQNLNPAQQKVFKNSGFSQIVPTDISLSNENANKTLKYLYDLITAGRNAMFTKSFNEKTNIFILNFISPSEHLSGEFLKVIYSKISEFYEDKTTLKQQKQLDILADKRDSLQKVINGLDYSNIKKKEISLGTWKNTDIEPQINRNDRKMMELSSIFGEVTKNYELLSFNLKTQKSIFQLIDAPIYPIAPGGFTKSSMIKYTLVFGILGGILLIIFLKMFKTFIYNLRRA